MNALREEKMRIIIPGTRKQKDKIKLLLKFIPDAMYLRMIYRIHFGRKLNLKVPKSFNEKIQWLKLNDRKTIYTKLVDKYEVKNVVSSIIGNEYIIPTLGVWDTFDDIDFDALPNQFVLKCTHDSGGVFICQNKNELNYYDVKSLVEDALNKNFYWLGREWPYKDVRPRILAEKYIAENDDSDLLDYKMMCFSGKVKCTFVCSNRNSKTGLEVTFYDQNWDVLPFERHYPRSKTLHAKPKCYEEMVKLAEKLSANITFVRVDFYVVNDRPFFGELTFYPGSGFEEFVPEIYDYILGDWIDCSGVANY